MIAYKGFTKDLTAVLGAGLYRFVPGKTYVETASKTMKTGFHCCENPFGCLYHYSLNGENRFFKVEASGNIDEDGKEKIACTKITLLNELSVVEMAYEEMRYIIAHPDRSGWEQSHTGVCVKSDMAMAMAAGHIAIARGRDPAVCGVTGSVLGLIVEAEGGIERCKLFTVNEKQAGNYIRLNKDRELEVIV